MTSFNLEFGTEPHLLLQMSDYKITCNNKGLGLPKKYFFTEDTTSFHKFNPFDNVDIGVPSAIHTDKQVIAFVKRQTSNMVCIFELKTNHCCIIDDIQKTVLDMQFASIKDKMILGLIDANSLYMYEIENAYSSLRYNLIMQVYYPLDNYEPKLDKVCWCPFVEGTLNYYYEDHIVVWARGNRFQCFNLKSLLNEFEGKRWLLTKENVDENYPVYEDMSRTFSWITMTSDGLSLYVGTLSGEVIVFKTPQNKTQRWTPFYIWIPHEGKPISSLFLVRNSQACPYNVMDNWNYIITGATNNSELKVWQSFNWKCMQTISLECRDDPANFKAELDKQERSLILTNGLQKVCYVLQLEKGKGQMDSFKKSPIVSYFDQISQFHFDYPFPSSILANVLYPNEPYTWLGENPFKRHYEDTIYNTEAIIIVLANQCIRKFHLTLRSNSIFKRYHEWSHYNNSDRHLNLSTFPFGNIARNLNPNPFQSTHYTGPGGYHPMNLGLSDNANNLQRQQTNVVFYPRRYNEGSEIQYPSNRYGNTLFMDNVVIKTEDQQNQDKKKSDLDNRRNEKTKNSNIKYERNHDDNTPDKGYQGIQTKYQQNHDINNPDKGYHGIGTKFQQNHDENTPDKGYHGIGTKYPEEHYETTSDKGYQGIETKYAQNQEGNISDKGYQGIETKYQQNHDINTPDKNKEGTEATETTNFLRNYIINAQDKNKKIMMETDKLKQQISMKKQIKDILQNEQDSNKGFKSMSNNSSDNENKNDCQASDNKYAAQNKPMNNIEKLLTFAMNKIDQNNQMLTDKAIPAKKKSTDKTSLKEENASGSEAQKVGETGPISTTQDDFQKNVHPDNGFNEQICEFECETETLFENDSGKSSVRNGDENGNPFEITGTDLKCLNEKLDRLMDVNENQNLLLNNCCQEFYDVKAQNTSENNSIIESFAEVESRLITHLNDLIQIVQNDSTTRLSSFMDKSKSDLESVGAEYVEAFNHSLATDLPKILSEQIHLEFDKQLTEKLNKYQQDISRKISEMLDSYLYKVMDKFTKSIESEDFQNDFFQSMMKMYEKQLNEVLTSSVDHHLSGASAKLSQDVASQVLKTCSKDLSSLVNNMQKFAEDIQNQQNLHKKDITYKLSSFYKDFKYLFKNYQNDLMTSAGLTTEPSRIYRFDLHTTAEYIKDVFRSQILPVGSTLTNIDENKTIIRESIVDFLAQNRIQEAFHLALSSNDLEIVFFTIESADFDQVFSPKCVLEQPVVLSMIQQLTVDMSGHNDMVHSYLAECLQVLDIQYPTFQTHASEILNQVHGYCIVFLLKNERLELRSKVKAMLNLVQSLQRKCDTLSKSPIPLAIEK